ncbi:hypothetical protein Tco_0995115, partial [Tanacetum coccineum]
ESVQRFKVECVNKVLYQGQFINTPLPASTQHYLLITKLSEELRSLVREMRMREYAAERLCDDLQDVILARDNQISSYMNEIDQLRYEGRRMLSEIFALEEEVARLRRGQSFRRCH